MLANQKINKQNNSIYDWKKRLEGIAFKAGNIIATAYFLAMTIIYPFFVKNGYYEIGRVKYLFFRNVSVAAIIATILVAIIVFFLQRLQGKKFSIIGLYKSLSITDWFIYAYFVSLLISYIFTPFTEEAFWGTEGWYMGLASQLLFIGIYFLFSRYLKWNNKLIYAALLSSGLIFLLGILNRYSLYPINMNGQTPGFISTLGNINWFCGYWSVISPMGVIFYWKSRSGWQQIIAGIYVLIAFLAGVTQGSSSAYLVFAGMFIFLFTLSFQENKEMYRLLQLCMLFALACQMARIFRYLPGLMVNYELNAVMTDTNVTLYIGLFIIAVYFLFYYLVSKKNIDVKACKKVRNVSIIIMAAIFLIYIILLVCNSCISGGVFGLSEVSVFTFGDEWASYRGATWNIGVQAYHSMPVLHKLIGIGPDCFTEYIYTIPDLSEHIYALFGNSRLTNAHNEWITLLVNQGILGLICYVGILATAFMRFVKKGMVQPVLYFCAASVLLYTVHNMVSFQQILNIPFVFIVLGIGEGLCSEHQCNRT